MIPIKKTQNRHPFTIYGLVVVSFIIMCILLIHSIRTMQQDYFDAIGRKAMVFSSIIVDDLVLTDSEVERLESLDFNELLRDSVNISFETHVRRYMPVAKVKYVYILRKIDEAPYSVTEGTQSDYGLPVGTPLDTIYLLDAVINDETRLADTDQMGYTDQDRYTSLPPEIEEICNSRQTSFRFYTDSWGTYISGFAPLYSVEGTYIGLLATDVFVDEYVSVIQQRAVALILFCLIILILLILAVAGFQKAESAEYRLGDARLKANKDVMTDFFNRRKLNEDLNAYEALVKEAMEGSAVLMLDIDHFKKINDTYGHPMGDEIIYAMSTIIRSHLSPNDYPFRYGGDEFLILSIDPDRDALETMAIEILQQINALSLDGVPQMPSLSVGIAYQPSRAEMPLTELIQQADKMLYHSKEMGRNRVSVNWKH